MAGAPEIEVALERVEQIWDVTEVGAGGLAFRVFCRVVLAVTPGGANPDARWGAERFPIAAPGASAAASPLTEFTAPPSRFAGRMGASTVRAQRCAADLAAAHSTRSEKRKPIRPTR